MKSSKKLIPSSNEKEANAHFLSFLKFPFASFSLRSGITPTFLASIASIGILIACGPYYAPRLLNYKSTIIENPTTGVDLLFPNNKKNAANHINLASLPERLQATYNTDIADLKKAAPKLPKKILDNYSAIRSDMIISAWDQRADQLINERQTIWLDKPTLAAIPKEFSLYLKGAISYRKGFPEQARTHWKSLLALPADERKYKTVWAAWMLARTSTADGEAMQWYTKVKQYTKDGFPDSLQVTAKDWTSFYALKSNDFITALTIYIKEGREKTTDPITASRNIKQVFYTALDKHHADPSKIFKLVAKNQDHAVALSYFISNLLSPGYHDPTNENPEVDQQSKITLNLWVNALRNSKRPNIDKELGICATTAYAIYDEKALQLCLNSMQKPTTESLWLQAKLATLKGNLEKASTIYSQTTESIKPEGADPENTDFYIYGSYQETGQTANTRYFNLYSEYACVELGLKHYGKALDLFLTANNQSDAAYIAETLLSPVELLDYVRNSETAQKSEFIKALLTRKLMRNEYFKDAKKFALEEHLQTYNKYIIHYRAALNKDLPAEMRAQAFITSAQIIRKEGNELFYLENDCRPFLRISAANRKMHENYDMTEYFDGPLPKAQDFTPKITPDELKRIQQNYLRISPVSTKDRLAADLLYRAAILLPRNDDRAAKLLWQAGDWTRPDPQVADKYYQSLVKRCPKTYLGKACDKRRWFLHAHELKVH